MWSWAHFAVARPTPRAGADVPQFGGPEPEVRHAYGARWNVQLRFPDRVKGALSTIRAQFEGMQEGEVVWEPYEYYLDPDRDLAPPIIIQDAHLWHARVPMVHFWMVEWHYPDRVMRQFGRWQRIPPLPPAQDWDEHEKLLVEKHSKEDHDRQPDWSQIHTRHIEVSHSYPYFIIS